MTQPSNKNKKVELLTRKSINRRNFISFTGFIGLNALAFGAWRWLYKSPEETPGITGGAHRPLRNALNQTDQVFKKTFSHEHLVKTFPRSMAAKQVRVNSRIGINNGDFNAADWMLRVNKNDGT